LPREKDQCDLDDGEQDREKGKNDERELDDSGAVLAAPEATRLPHKSSAPPPG
jgi:hypothetical protein